MDKHKIFIIEDESIIARDLESILSNFDYNVSGVFANAEDAISKITHNEPDLVLMDITLRGNIDGIEAAKRIKKDYSLPIIFLTAFDDEATIKRIKEINHDGYLVKPFEEDTLNSFVGKALNKVKDNIVMEKEPDEKDLKIKSLEEKLQKTSKELEQFAYIASHDLQEPLRMVASYVQLLQKRYQSNLDQEANEFINFAVDGVNRMKNIINDLLSFSRINAHNNITEDADLNKISEVALKSVKAARPQSNVTFNCAKLPTVKGNSEQITQLFYSLIDNSIKFSGENPNIGISYTQNGDNWTFSISDNGIGIEEKYSDRVFEIFQKLHNMQEYPGTGMGLAVSKKIIENHGGKIWFDSVPGEGCTFHFTLPIHDNPVKDNG